MKYSYFEDRITENAKNFSREFLDVRNVAMTIGSVGIKGFDFHIAVIRVKGIPFGHTGLSTNWHLATAEGDLMGAVSDTINKSDVTVNAIETPQLTMLQVGRDPFLPDGSLLTVSPAREFYPTIVVPAEAQIVPGTEDMLYNDRYQIVIPHGGTAEV
jgi:hypothetical protein